MSDYEGRLLNAEPSPDDPRDFPFADMAADIPPRFVIPGLGPRLDQGNTGTCGAHGGAGLRQWQERHQGKPGWLPVDIYRLYDLVKIIVDKQPDPGRVIGTHIRSVLRFLAGTGTPTIGSAASGAGGKIATYWRVAPSQLAIKSALMRYGPLLVRCDWDAAWMRLPFNRILNPPLNRIVGGHIFLLFGWDDAVNGGSWLMRNSWGRWSALGTGNAYLAFRYFTPRRPEIWASTDVKD